MSFFKLGTSTKVHLDALWSL